MHFSLTHLALISLPVRRRGLLAVALCGSFVVTASLAGLHAWPRSRPDRVGRQQRECERGRPGSRRNG